MRIRRFVYAALIATGALAVAAPIAGATPTTAPTTTAPTTTTTTTAPTTQRPTDKVSASVTVTPGVAKPGQKVKLTLKCTGPDGDSHGKVTAPALNLGGLYQTGTGSPFYSNSTVKANTKPGTYSVAFECYGETFKSSFKVVGDNDKQQAPQVKVKPKGAAQTGGGATAS